MVKAIPMENGVPKKVVAKIILSTSGVLEEYLLAKNVKKEKRE
jgi:hypothetical protein